MWRASLSSLQTASSRSLPQWWALQQSSCGRRSVATAVRRRNFSTNQSVGNQTTVKPPPTEESFFSKHVGKIALTVLSIAGGLVYTYYLSIQSRNDLEKTIQQSTILDPYDILELRYTNELTAREYSAVVQLFADQLSRPGSLISYRDFVQQTNTLLQSQFHKQIHAGHLLDRFVAVYHERQQTGLQDEAGRPNENFSDAEYPVDLLLVLFNLCMLRDATPRIDALHHLGCVLEGAHVGDDSGVKAISRETVARLVSLLQTTDQLPSEKQVIETGVKWPYRTHRRKTVDDLMLDKKPAASNNDNSSATKTNKSDNKDNNNAEGASCEQWRVGDLEQLLTSKKVCAWGACYKGRDED